MADVLTLTLLGGLLALDGTSMGQFMVSRPIVAGVITGWVLGDPALGLLIGGVLEVYFISVFPVGGAEFPEGGPPTLVAVASGIAISGPAGLAFGSLMGFLWTRLGARSVRWLRRVVGRMIPDPSGGEVSTARIVRAHLLAMALDFSRGCVLSVSGLLVGRLLSSVLGPLWPFGMPGTVGILALGACLPAGAYLRRLGGWKRRGIVFGAGVAGFLVGSMLL